MPMANVARSGLRRSCSSVANSGSSVTDEDLDQLLSLVPAITVRTVHGAGHIIARERHAALAQTITVVTSAWR